MAEKRLRDILRCNSTMEFLWGCFIVTGLLLLGIITYKVIRHDSSKDKAFSTPESEKAVTPIRGNILDCKDRILATSTISYDITMDCTVQHDTLWNNHIQELANALSAKFGKKTSAEYMAMFRKARAEKRRSIRIVNDVNQLDIYQVRKMPIFNKGRFRGGYIETPNEKRLYPYGASAKRTIGYVKTNSSNGRTTKGIEGNYDEYLHGKDGKQIERKSDFGYIPVDDSRNERAHDGIDVRSTIDIDIQNIADQALRKTVEKSEMVEMACVIVMETQTGAIKAMVNLGRNKSGVIGEWNNYALMMADPPGSVFKTAVLMAMLEEGYIDSLDQRIPTYGGVWRYHGAREPFVDTKHLSMSRFPSGYITVREAFEMSANNPFRQMLCDTDAFEKTFDNNPQRFVDKVRSFGLVDTIDFDLKGAAAPFILDPTYKMGNKSGKGFWDGSTLARMAIGYNMEVSPLNLITFYNAIANDGKMMKPYLVDAIVDNGRVKEGFKPTVLREQICRKDVCDTLKKVMSMVTSNKGGTAYWQLHDAVCPIAGKTGTAQRLFRGRNGKMTYNDGGVESQRGTFVGFFPADKPKYTAAVVVWSRPSAANFYGAVTAAPVFKEIADKIYCLNED